MGRLGWIAIGLALALIGALASDGTASAGALGGAVDRSPQAATPHASSIEPVRLCGTNSSRSRRCYFGNRECLRNGHSQEQCDRALAICRSCIDGMVACSRQASSSCGVCYERYGTCMQPWVALVE